jgi:2-amino-4-hydroxy-6-hydroxymethyldihydropteridine diphosphokinase
MRKIFLGLGSNLGDRENNLRNAGRRIGEITGSIILCSSVYETEPWGFETGNVFLNQVICIETDLDHISVFEKIVLVESEMGRTGSREKYSDRIIDIDILLFDDLVTYEKKIIIPHPMLHARKFVLVPLCEIAPDLIHPVLGKSISVLCDHCEDKRQVIPYAGTRNT